MRVGLVLLRLASAAAAARDALDVENLHIENLHVEHGVLTARELARPPVLGAAEPVRAPRGQPHVDAAVGVELDALVAAGGRREALGARAAHATLPRHHMPRHTTPWVQRHGHPLLLHRTPAAQGAGRCRELSHCL